MKKMRRIIGSLLLTLTLVCSSLTAFAAASLADYGLTEEQVLQAVQGYYTEVSALSADEVAAMKTQYASDAVLLPFFESWEKIQKKDLGEFVEIDADGLKVEVSDEGFSASLPVKYENETIYVNVSCDQTTAIKSLLITTKSGSGSGLGLGEIFEKAGLNTALGMGVVFAVLILISIIIYLLGVICGSNKANSGSVVKKAPRPQTQDEEIVAAIAAAQAAAQSDDKELVAVIAAAISAATGMSTDSFVVRSIRKVRRR